MLDVAHERCAHPGCTKRSSRGSEGSDKAEFCHEHEKDGVVLTKSKSCSQRGRTLLSHWRRRRPHGKEDNRDTCREDRSHPRGREAREVSLAASVHVTAAGLLIVAAATREKAKIATRASLRTFWKGRAALIPRTTRTHQRTEEGGASSERAMMPPTGLSL